MRIAHCEFRIQMKAIPLILFLILLSSACNRPQSFAEDPFCQACIEKACKTADPTFQNYVNGLSAEDKAQMIALMEDHDRCFEVNPWALTMADEAYQTYGHAFYAPEQKMHQTRILRAFDEIIGDTPNRVFAVGYLKHHADAWKKAAWAKDKITALEGLAESDDVFEVLVLCADSELLEKLTQMESTPARDGALMYRWQDLGEEYQKRSLNAWISASWSMQQSGSIQLPQYLTLDWKRRPFPKGVPNMVATLKVESIKINNQEVQRKDWQAKDEFNWQPLADANVRHGRVNLTPWLSSIDTYSIAAKAEMRIGPEKTSAECLNHEETCEDTPILSVPVILERKYKVYGGLETGMPRRNKSDSENAVTTKSLKFSLCSQGRCQPIWDGKIIKERGEPLPVMLGEDFYIQGDLGNADQAVAMRLMARANSAQVWREIGIFFSNAPMVYDVPMRGDIDLGDLCTDMGKCKLELELRPSLRMARRDPRISKYYGATLAMGTITLDILNRTPEQIGD